MRWLKRRVVDHLGGTVGDLRMQCIRKTWANFPEGDGQKPVCDGPRDALFGSSVEAW